MSLKFSHNKSYSDCIHACVKSVLKWTLETNEGSQGADMIKLISGIFKSWATLFKRLLNSEVE